METYRYENYRETKEEMDCRYRKRLQKMGIRRRRKQCKERAEWKRITEKAKTHSGS
jgi:hypothetical protein